MIVHTTCSSLEHFELLIISFMLGNTELELDTNGTGKGACLETSSEGF